MAKAKKRMVGIYLEESAIEQLRQLADLEYRTVNGYVKVLVEQHLKEQASLLTEIAKAKSDNLELDLNQ